MQNDNLHITADGSHTLYSEVHNAYYHSLNGALTESLHIFIDAGYLFISNQFNQISILEVGLGSGLNAALTAKESSELAIQTEYTAIELYPISKQQIANLNYNQILASGVAEFWINIMLAEWGGFVTINDYFNVIKLNSDFTKWVPDKTFNLIYFDAFAPEDQPEMWSAEMFQKLYDALSVGGVLVTYSSKGIVKQALRSVGFKVERLAGPPGKRHILRAVKG
ncbi:hypothetical protein CYCD_19740 [Tenuifilaceae bacterium CYCD]|nr:hypothetical protein CYCD_19740 [Tenuifilaceae bacterium CYCD]